MYRIKYIFPALVLASTLYSCGGNSTINDDFSTNTIIVKLAMPQGGNGINIVAASGTVESIKSAQIATRMMGTITKIYVNIGEHVQEGQLLFTLNAADIVAKGGQASANIAQIEAALTNAKKDYDRFTILYKENSATSKELDDATLQYKAVQAQLSAAKQMRDEVNANMDYARVTAPFSGIVTQKMMDAGSLANPGVPVLSIEQPGELQVSSTISENNIDRIHNGTVANVYIASVNKNLQGIIKQISLSALGNAGQFLVKISLPNAAQQGVLPGMYANVSFKLKDTIQDSTSQILIPVKSLVHKDELTGIYTVSANNTALLRWIRTGKLEGNFIEVTSGLRLNEEYIEQADGRLYNGVPVKVQ